MIGGHDGLHSPDSRRIMRHSAALPRFRSLLGSSMECWEPNWGVIQSLPKRVRFAENVGTAQITCPASDHLANTGSNLRRRRVS